MKGPQRTARYVHRSVSVTTNGRLSSCKCLPSFARVPRNATYVRVLCCGAACCLEFCFVFPCLRPLLLLFVPSLRVVLFPCVSSVESGKDAAFSFVIFRRCCALFLLVFLRLNSACNQTTRGYKQQMKVLTNSGNAIYTTGGVSTIYITGDVYKRLNTSPALVRRTHLGRSRKQLEYVGMGKGYHGSYRGAETVQSSKELWAPLKYCPIRTCIHHR